MRRAIREEQKEERRQAIVDMAWQLFQERPYPEVNILDVAQGVGLAKGTVYLYFPTKEELFLAVQVQQFTAWFDDIDGRLQNLPENSSEEVVQAITDSLAARPSLTRLFAILHVILEQNIGYDTAVQFKRMLLDRIGVTGSLIESRLTFLEAGQGVQFLLRTYALVIGLQHMADPAPVVREALIREPELAIFSVNFSSELFTTLVTLLKGMQTE
ncbi:MAG: TetR/AcrR family transcriptional regulator [Chloroflexi bacterium]|nr:TetR/AcrR family transcriptional regulator [Chloroflexota bacterium]